jgi:hypothetical protein
MPIIYEIDCPAAVSGRRAYTSKELAAYAARVLIDLGATGPIEIERVELPALTLKLVTDMINAAESGDYALSRETVQTVTRGARVAVKAAPAKPPANWIEDTLPDRPAPQIEVVAGRQIRQYPTGQGRWIYAVGGVGFYHLDEAREYAKRGSE